uniref:alpha/beta hydrolase n=1 Tax=Ningiella ruwaisensis TaxID=2364274 RepID=UPI001F501B8A|nr:alpha/beta hydrolase fold domain-containing protein [Ningiella ruwaisensis]
MLTAANAPKYVFEGEIKRDIAYGELPSQKLDIYLPAQLSDASNALRLPVVVFFHGGRWTTGNKGQYEFVGMRLADLGYIAVIPNTRLYPQVKFPTFIEDSAQAIAWVDDNIADYQGSNDLFVLGHSSGAHMGAMVVANQAYLAAFDKTPDIINAFAGMAGPYDFEPEAPELKDMFGPPSNYPNMQVTTFIDGSEPPMLLIYTENDSTVHIRNLELLKAGIEKANGRVETIIYDSGGHTATVGAFSWANPSGLPVAADVDTFFRAHL